MLTDMDQPLGARGRQRARDPRGDRHDPRPWPGGLHGARARRRSRICSRSPISASTRTRGAGAPRTRSRTARPCRVRAVDPRAGRRSRSRRVAAAPVVTPSDGAGGRVRRPLGAIAVGNAALHLGAGRRTKEDTIDHAVGVVCHVKRGDEVDAGDCSPRYTHATKRRSPRRRSTVLAAYESGTMRRRQRRSSSTFSPSVPELPEVETVRAQLAPVLTGGTLRMVAILDERLTRPIDPRHVAAQLEGERVAAVERRGKYLVVRFESGLVLWFTSG